MTDNASGSKKPDISFEDWLSQIATILLAKYALDMEIGDEWPGRESYDQGMTSAEGAIAWIEFQGLEDWI